MAPTRLLPPAKARRLLGRLAATVTRGRLGLTLTVAVVTAATPGVAVAAPGVTTTIPVGNAPEGVAVNPKTDTVYVANEYDDTVSVISGRTNTVTATIPVGRQTHWIAVN